MENHVSEEEVRRLIGNHLEQDEARRVTAHLLSGCPRCQPHLAALAGALKESEDAEHGDAVGLDEDLYDEPIGRAIASVLKRDVPRWEQERKQLNRFVARGTSWALGRPRRREEGWPVVEALLQLSAAERFRDRGLMLHLSFGAMLVARQLDPAVYGKALVADFKARATAEYANACRINDRFSDAESYLVEAEALAEEGTGDALLAGRLADIEASLRMSQRRLGDALERFDLAEMIYRDIGENHLAGRMLISKGVATAYDGRPQEAAQFLREGMQQIDAKRDQQLGVTARHNLLLALVDSGQYREAGRMLLKAGLREAFADDPVNLLRLRWTEGRILAGRNRLAQAERAFREVREGFLAGGRSTTLRSPAWSWRECCSPRRAGRPRCRSWRRRSMKFSGASTSTARRSGPCATSGRPAGATRRHRPWCGRSSSSCGGSTGNRTCGLRRPAVSRPGRRAGGGEPA